MFVNNLSSHYIEMEWLGVTTTTCQLWVQHYTVSQINMHHPIVMIISSNLNWFSKFFHCC